jgi:hypothetical protein
MNVTTVPRGTGDGCEGVSITEICAGKTPAVFDAARLGPACFVSPF